jgi:CTP:molybdopterin cytidylyltransferase MocA
MQVAAIILAAGASARFGTPKQLVRIGGRTTLGIVADVATASGLSPVIVVAPSALPVPETSVAVWNDVPAAGLSRSLRLGLQAVPPDAEAAVILLADQPTVGVALLQALDGWRGGSPIVATRVDGVLGPPVLIEREGFGLADGLTGDTGLRDLLRSDPSLVTAVDSGPIPDVDTPEDLDAITEACPGCGERYLPHVLDETHPYIVASAGCWAAFREGPGPNARAARRPHRRGPQGRRLPMGIPNTVSVPTVLATDSGPASPTALSDYLATR